jgi:hypothetical protein
LLLKVEKNLIQLRWLATPKSDGAGTPDDVHRKMREQRERINIKFNRAP